MVIYTGYDYNTLKRKNSIPESEYKKVHRKLSDGLFCIVCPNAKSTCPCAKIRKRQQMLRMKLLKAFILLLHCTDSLFQLPDRQVEIIPIIIAVGHIPITITSSNTTRSEGSDSSSPPLKFFIGRFIPGKT